MPPCSTIVPLLAAAVTVAAVMVWAEMMIMTAMMTTDQCPPGRHC